MLGLYITSAESKINVQKAGWLNIFMNSDYFKAKLMSCIVNPNLIRCIKLRCVALPTQSSGDGDFNLAFNGMGEVMADS